MALDRPNGSPRPTGRDRGTKRATHSIMGQAVPAYSRTSGTACLRIAHAPASEPHIANSLYSRERRVQRQTHKHVAPRANRKACASTTPACAACRPLPEAIHTSQPAGMALTRRETKLMCPNELVWVHARSGGKGARRQCRQQRRYKTHVIDASEKGLACQLGRAAPHKRRGRGIRARVAASRPGRASFCPLSCCGGRSAGFPDLLPLFSLRGFLREGLQTNHGKARLPGKHVVLGPNVTNPRIRPKITRGGREIHRNYSNSPRWSLLGVSGGPTL